MKTKRSANLSLSQDSAIKASLGALRIPLPKRSIKREAKTWPQFGAVATKGRLKVEIPYPMAMSHLRWPRRSESQPEKTFNRLAVLSAIPSIRPIMDFRNPQYGRQEQGNQGVNHLGTEIHKKTDHPGEKDVAIQSADFV